MNEFMQAALEPVGRPWWGFASWLVPLLLVGVIVGVAVWLVARAARPAPVTGLAGNATDRTSAANSALEAVRMRYVRGEIGRDACLLLSDDLAARTTGPVSRERSRSDAAENDEEER